MSKQIDDNGFWLIEGNPVSKEGVFPYLGKSISPSLDPGEVYMVYRPYSELSSAETLKSFDGIPFIENHEMLGDGFTSTDTRTPQGVLMNCRAENGGLYGDLKIFSDAMKASIENGKKELSLGYKCNYRHEPGEWNGQHYDFVQTDLRGNHIALVDKGRMGSSVRVYDWAFDALEVEVSKAITNNKESEEMPDENKDKKSENEVQDEAVDKRKLIDEIGGILKDKVDDEIIRTIIGKCEKMAYNASEASKADDEDEKPEDKGKEGEEKKPEAEAADKCGKDKACGKDKSCKDECGDPKSEEKKAEDKCGKDEFFDAPHMKKTVEKMLSEGEISEGAAKKILGSLKYERAEDEDADPEKKKPEEEKKSGMDAADVVKMIDRRNALAKQLSDHIGEFATDGMTEEDVASYACGKLGMDAADGAEALALVHGYLAGAKNTAKTYSMDSATPEKSGELSEQMKNYLNGK